MKEPEAPFRSGKAPGRLRKNAVQDAKGESKLPVADKTCRKADAHADRKF